MRKRQKRESRKAPQVSMPVPGQNGSRKRESSQKPSGDQAGVGAMFLVWRPLQIELPSPWPNSPCGVLPADASSVHFGKPCGQKNLDSHTLGSHHTLGLNSETPRQWPPSSSGREPESSTYLPRPTMLSNTPGHPLGCNAHPLG